MRSRYTYREKNDEEFQRIMKDRKENYRRCKNCDCGYWLNKGQDRYMCSLCGHYVYRDDKTRFIYEMKARINKCKEVI